MTNAADNALTLRMEELDTLIQEFERNADPASKVKLTTIIQTLLEFHGEGLRRILNRIAVGGGSGVETIRALSRDELLSQLFALHDLHPDDMPTRVERALASVQPTLASHGGRVELLGISEEGAVHLRLEGNCHGCPSSRLTLRHLIEQAIYGAAPEVVEIKVEGLSEEPRHAESSTLIPVSAVVNRVTKPMFEGCGIPAPLSGGS